MKSNSVSKYSARDAYNWFRKKNPDTTVTYPLYKQVISQFNKKVSNAILEGQVFNMGHHLGTLRIKKIERTFTRPTIDWGETNKLKKQGIKQLVYYTDDFYYRWNWDKSRSRAKNKSVYTFSPTSGATGNRKALVHKLKGDDFAYLNYKP